MSSTFRQIKLVFFGLLGTALGLLSLFFLYYTVRLIYLNLTMPDVAAHRSFGMYIGFVAFPVATLIFGGISLFCFKRLRGAPAKMLEAKN